MSLLYMNNKIQQLLIMLSVPLLASSMPVAADISSVPLIGGTYDLSRVIKEEVVSGIELTAEATKDISIFAVGGLSLDAYVLTLPLDASVKERVIARISNPFYSIPLKHIINTFKDRYSGTDKIPLFSQHIEATYKSDQYPGMKHTLFQWSEDGQKINESSESPDNSLDFDREIIATFVTIYDALFSEKSLILEDHLPEQYQYLTKTEEGLHTINVVQPLIVKLLERVLKALEPGDMKDAIEHIIRDSASDRVGTVNNKAQAITITLIDFVRLNALKGYRQYELEQQRVDAFERWMRTTFKEDAKELVSFLKAQNSRKHGVQITVDGLQGQYLKSLTQPLSNPFIRQVFENHKNYQRFKPVNSSVESPEHSPQLQFLEFISQALSQVNTGEQLENDPVYLPFFKWLYKDFEKSISAGGISSTPTISVRNLPLIWTGASVAGDMGTSIPNFHFVDRDKDRAYYFFGNDALQLDRLLEDKHTKTMFDRLDHLKTLNCNAQYDWNAHVSFDGLVNLGLGEVNRDFGESLCLSELSARAEIEQELKKDRQQLIDELEAYQSLSFWSPFALVSKKLLIQELIHNLAVKGERGMPDYLLIYNPWPDHFAHFSGPFSDEILSPTGELNRLDYWLGMLKRVYQQAGVYDTTLWGMAGDHGLAPIFYYLNPETQVLEKLKQDIGRDIIIKKISSDEGEGPKITNALNYPSNKGVDIVVASTAGGNFMMDFFKDQNANWSQQPLYGDLLNWKPIEFDEKEAGIDIISEIAVRLEGSLDYLAVRQSTCDLNQCKVRLVSHRNGVRKDEIIHRIEDKIAYFNAENTQIAPTLLDLKKTNAYKNSLSKAEQKEKQQLYRKCITQVKISQSSSWCSEAEWRMLAFYTPRPDSVNQLAHLYDEARAGTVNLFPKEGIGYNTKVPGRHAGEHFHEKDAFIGFWGAPVNGKFQLKTIDNGSLAPTIYEYLTEERVIVGSDGWGFPSVLDQLITH